VAKIDPKPNTTPQDDGDNRETNPSQNDRTQNNPGTGTQGNLRPTSKPEPVNSNWSKPVEDKIKSPNAAAQSGNERDEEPETPSPTEVQGTTEPAPTAPKTVTPPGKNSQSPDPEAAP
jgi:hypothetical protein